MGEITIQYAQKNFHVSPHPSHGHAELGRAPPIYSIRRGNLGISAHRRISSPAWIRRSKLSSPSSARSCLSRAALPTEMLALRRQVAVPRREMLRPSLRMVDRVFRVVHSRLWPGRCAALVFVQPETVIGWHRKGFRLFWTRKSGRRKSARPPVSRGVRDLLDAHSPANPSSGRTKTAWRAVLENLPCSIAAKNTPRTASMIPSAAQRR